ncbi:hypothetical protein ACIBLB_39045 [Streptosporangium canum]|uniref:hypothetical protein n=1 Tax=Streptosporangium canum TaxID=324952 RepID=UPI0037B73E5F
MTKVAKMGTGRYRVQSHSDINAVRSVPIATLYFGADWSSEIYAAAPHRVQGPPQLGLCRDR